MLSGGLRREACEDGGVPFPFRVGWDALPLPLPLVVEMERDEEVFGSVEMWLLVRLEDPDGLRMLKGCMSGRLRGGAGETPR